MNKLSQLKGYYIIGNVKGNVQTETIHFQRKGAIALFIGDSTTTWNECEKSGWRCFKVDISFDIVTKID